MLFDYTFLSVGLYVAWPTEVGIYMYRKLVFSGHLKIDKTKILMEIGSLMKVKSIAECSKGEHSAIL